MVVVAAGGGSGAIVAPILSFVLVTVAPPATVELVAARGGLAPPLCSDEAGDPVLRAAAGSDLAGERFGLEDTRASCFFSGVFPFDVGGVRAACGEVTDLAAAAAGEGDVDDDAGVAFCWEGTARREGAAAAGGGLFVVAIPHTDRRASRRPLVSRLRRSQRPAEWLRCSEAGRVGGRERRTHEYGRGAQERIDRASVALPAVSASLAPRRAK